MDKPDIASHNCKSIFREQLSICLEINGDSKITGSVSSRKLRDTAMAEPVKS